jgi:hypothetical protein
MRKSRHTVRVAYLPKATQLVSRTCWIFEGRLEPCVWPVDGNEGFVLRELQWLTSVILVTWVAEIWSTAI